MSFYYAIDIHHTSHTSLDQAHAQQIYALICINMRHSKALSEPGENICLSHIELHKKWLFSKHKMDSQKKGTRLFLFTKIPYNIITARGSEGLPNHMVDHGTLPSFEPNLTIETSDTNRCKQSYLRSYFNYSNINRQAACAASLFVCHMNFVPVHSGEFCHRCYAWIHFSETFLGHAPLLHLGFSHTLLLLLLSKGREEGRKKKQRCRS